MINEKHVHYLLTVAEEHSITAASKKLFISQPALSRFILDVEHTLGTALFIRDRGNLHLTQAGEIYLQGCQEVLAISRSVEKEISQLSNSLAGKITLGVTPLTGEFVLPAIWDTFEAAFPSVELTLREERMSDLQDMVKKGAVDMALVYHTSDSQLTDHLLYENPIYVQVPPSFKKQLEPPQTAGQFPLIPPEALADQAMILLKKGREMREVADRFFESFTIVPDKILETENMHLASTLVNLDKGFTFVPAIFMRGLHKQNSANCYAQIAEYPMKRALYCCHRKDAYLTEAERFLIRQLPGILSQL